MIVNAPSLADWVIMVVLPVTASVVEVVMVKVMVWVEAMVDMEAVVEVRVIDALADVEIIMVGLNVIVFNCVFPSSNAVDVSSDGTDVMLGVLTGIDIEVLDDVNANEFAVVLTTLELPVSTPLNEFTRSAAFDCRPFALLD